MDFKLNKDEEKLKRSFRDLCNETIKPAAADVDRSGTIPDSHWQALAEFGYLGFGFDESLSGKGASLVLWVNLGEELARSCASTFVSVMASSNLFGHIIQLHGTDAQKEKYLPAIAKGELKGAVAITDPKGPPDSEPLETTAERRNGNIVLNGTKPYVTNGPACDAALVLAITDPSSDPKGLTLFVVDAGTEGFHKGERVSTMGIRGCQVGSLKFDNCVIDEANIIGGWNGGRKVIDDLTTLRRIWWTVYGVGVGQACIDEAIAYASVREVNGRRISKHQEVHFKIAEMHMMTDTARQLMYKAAWLFDTKQKAAIIAAAAKLLATEMATECSHKAQQIYGAKGFICGSAVERLYRDARLGEIEGETSEVLRVILAKDVLEEFSI